MQISKQGDLREYMVLSSVKLPVSLTVSDPIAIVWFDYWWSLHLFHLFGYIKKTTEKIFKI